jgi:hypothetical protein
MGAARSGRRVADYYFSCGHCCFGGDVGTMAESKSARSKKDIRKQYRDSN